MKPQRLFALLPTAMLAYALFPESHGYFQILRMIVSVSATAIVLSVSLEAKRVTGWAIIFAVVALAFNPFSEFHLNHETWYVLDVASACAFGVFAVSAFARLRKPTHQ
jgi:hypothetical protein